MTYHNQLRGQQSQRPHINLPTAVWPIARTVVGRCVEDDIVERHHTATGFGDSSVALPFAFAGQADHEGCWSGDRADGAVWEFPVALQYDSVAEIEFRIAHLADFNDDANRGRDARATVNCMRRCFFARHPLRVPDFDFAVMAMRAGRAFEGFFVGVVVVLAQFFPVELIAEGFGLIAQIDAAAAA